MLPSVGVIPRCPYCQRHRGRRLHSLGAANVAGHFGGRCRNRFMDAPGAGRVAGRRPGGGGWRGVHRVDSRAARIRCGVRSRPGCSTVHSCRGGRHDDRPNLGIAWIPSRRRSTAFTNPFCAGFAGGATPRRACCSSARFWWPWAAKASPRSREHWAEGSLWLFAVAICCAGIFWFGSGGASRPLIIVLALLLVVVGAIRFGLVVAAFGSLVISASSGLSFALGRGVFREPGQIRRPRHHLVASAPRSPA